MVNTLKIDPRDNVVMALSDLGPGTILEWDGRDGAAPVKTMDAIPFGHKVAVAPIAKGAQVTKYGASIGLATQDIRPGQHVHSHNLATVRGAARS